MEVKDKRDFAYFTLRWVWEGYPIWHQSPKSKTSPHTLTHWGRVTHICVGNLTIIGSDNGLSPGRRQAITWTNVGVLLTGPLGTHFCEMLTEILIFSFKKMRLQVSSAKRPPFCLGLNVLIDVWKAEEHMDDMMEDEWWMGPGEELT